MQLSYLSALAMLVLFVAAMIAGSPLLALLSLLLSMITLHVAGD